MKQPLPPSISAALADVANMADQLAATFCDYPAKGLMPAETAACLDNLDSVASALTWKELEHAPAMLNAVARAYRQSFPADSLGWEDAARLNNIAVLIAENAPPAFAAWPNLPHRS
jgi:hypothetical protein